MLKREKIGALRDSSIDDALISATIIIMSQPFSEELRQAVRDSELSRYEIAKRTGIFASALALFVRGERGLRLDSIDRLMDVLELEIRPRRKGKRG
jgi:predicted transcriptional regulator